MFFIILREVDLEDVSPSVKWNLGGVPEYTDTNDKYPVQGFENLQLPIQMQLSEKPKTFSEFFILFVESTSNFEDFEKKHDGHG